MIGVWEILFAVLILGGVLFAGGYGGLRAWRFIASERRQHRLLRDADERDHQRLLAQDYQEVMLLK